VDIARYYAGQNNPEGLTFPFVLVMIVGTIIPIAVNLWYLLVFRQG